MSLDNLNWTIEYYEGNIQECNSLLNEIQNYDKIPLLNYVPLRNFSDGALIRYRGMVQDMLNPEYYSPSYTVINTQSKQSYTVSGKYRDIPVCKANEEFKSNEEEIVPKERQVFFCIPLPGCNKWVESVSFCASICWSFDVL
ncbi:hypothetical protein RUM44_001016 [Polyplax serrata]|uniref:Mini-chromosome maintenance complex-binding protein n=1 Tax=Polyplax serrata TaxID=468196 RepID=A0ABR1B7L6_POLSC